MWLHAFKNKMLYAWSYEGYFFHQTMCLFSDHIFEQILYSSAPELSEARDILHNIVCRRLYKCVGQTTSETHVDVSQVSWGLSYADRDGLGLKDQQIFIRHIIFTIVYYHTVIKLYKLPFPAIQQRFTRNSEDKKVTQMAQRLKVGLHDIEKKNSIALFSFPAIYVAIWKQFRQVT